MGTAWFLPPPEDEKKSSAVKDTNLPGGTWNEGASPKESVSSVEGY